MCYVRYKTLSAMSTNPSVSAPLPAVPSSWPSGSPMHPSHGLDQRSSLRKMTFPASTKEALLRLLRHCAAFAGGRGKQPSPREMEGLLNAIDEFIFGCGGSAGAGGGTALPSFSSAVKSAGSALKNMLNSPAFVELQIIQVESLIYLNISCFYKTLVFYDTVEKPLS